MGSPRPPRLARWLLGRLLPPEATEYVAGDLDEEWLRYRRPAGRVRAWAWYWAQTMRSILDTRDTEVSMTPTPDRVPGPGARLVALAGDLRFAWRTLRRSPGYAAAALLTLGIGIGASVAIFSAVNDVLLRPLPFPDPSRLGALWESNVQRDWHQVEAAPANIEDWRARTTTFSDIAFANGFPQAVSLMTDEGPARAVVAEVSGTLFQVLGVPPMLGRTFRDDETYQPGLVVLSYATWRLHFGADPSIVGRTIRLDGRPHEVIGVMGPEFVYPISEADVWRTPAAMGARRQSIWWRQAHVVRPIGRLAPGASFAQADAELRAISADLEREHPDTNTGMVGGVTPLRTFLAGDRRATLLLFLGAVGVLQLIACANLANLMLARATGREQELAVRAALGAGRARLVRQTLVESLLLAAGGTAIGLALGVAGLQAIAAVSPADLAGVAFHLDVRMAAFAIGLCLASAMLGGLWPAWRGTRVDPVRHIRDGARSGTAGRERLFAANAVVAFEVAMAVLLVSAAGLLVRSFDRIHRIDPGVDVSHVLTFQVHPSTGEFPNAGARAGFGINFAREIQTLPGVEVAGVGRGLPLTGYAWSSDFTIEGWGPGRFGLGVRHREEMPEYFQALRVPLVAGRMFDDRDLAPDAPVPVVVNQAFVDRYFPDASPVGRRVTFDREATADSYWYPIVGVVGNERKDLPTAPVPEIIAHLRGDVPSTLTFAVRTAVPPLSIVPQIRDVLASYDREAPLLAVRTMEQVAAEASAPARFAMTLFGAFAVAALLLAAIGVYGVANQAARARTREVGIRIALGAQGPTVVRQLMRRGAWFCGAGLAAGLAGVLAFSGLLESRLYEVDARDPATSSSSPA
ncbi:MAG: ADOP family duplicated permease [Vicinamibacterales bacterium]